MLKGTKYCENFSNAYSALSDEHSCSASSRREEEEEETVKEADADPQLFFAVTEPGLHAR